MIRTQDRTFQTPGIAIQHDSAGEAIASGDVHIDGREEALGELLGLLGRSAENARPR